MKRWVNVLFVLGKLAFWIAVPLALLIGGLFGYSTLRDWNQDAQRFAAVVQQATGRQLFVAGGTEFRFFPQPQLQLNDVRLDNLPGAASDAFISAKSLVLTPSLLSALTGELALADVKVVAPVIALEILPDGRQSWDVSAGGGAAALAASGGLPVKQVTIESGVLKAQRRETQYNTRLGGIEGVWQPAENGAFHFKGTLNREGVALGVDLASRAPLSAAVIPLKLQLKEGASTLQLEGQWQKAAAEQGARYQFALQGELEPRLLPLGNRLASKTEGGPGRVNVQGQIEGDAKGLKIPSLKLEGAVLKGTGEASLSLSEPRPALMVNLLLNEAELAADTLLSDGAATLAPQAEASTAASDPSFRVGDIGFGSYFELNLLSDIDLQFSVQLNEARFQQESMRDIRLKVLSVPGGGLELNELVATLPGETALEAKGSITDDGSVSNNAARFMGNVRLYGNSLRDFLTWLKVELPPIPEDRLGGFAISTNAVLSRREVAMPAIVARVDETSITGGSANVSNDPSKPTQLTLVMDHLDLDSYLPKLDALIEEAGGSKQEAQYEALNAGLRKFDFLRVVNSVFGATDLMLTVQNLSYRGETVQRAGSRIRFGSSKLEFSDIDLLSSHLQMRGKIDIDASGLKPKIDANLEFQDFNTADIPEIKLLFSDKQAAEAVDAAVPTSDRWSRQLLDLQDFRMFDGKARLFFNSFTHQNVVLENLNVSLTMQENFLYMENIRGQMFDGGKLDGKAIVNLGIQPTFSLSFALSNASLPQALEQLLGVDVVPQGRFSSSGSISTMGQDIRTMMSRLEGSLNLILRGAKVEGVDFVELTKALSKVLSANQMRALADASLRPGAPGSMEYDYAAGSASLTSGTLVLSDFQLLSPNFPPLVLTGNLNLANWKYDMLVKTGLPLDGGGGYSLRREASPADVPIVGRLSGSIDSPSLIWDKQPIERYWEKRFYR